MRAGRSPGPTVSGGEESDDAEDDRMPAGTDADVQLLVGCAVLGVGVR